MGPPQSISSAHNSLSTARFLTTFSHAVRLLPLLFSSYILVENQQYKIIIPVMPHIHLSPDNDMTDSEAALPTHFLLIQLAELQTDKPKPMLLLPQ
jgi:hypothetical protein